MPHLWPLKKKKGKSSKRNSVVRIFKWLNGLRIWYCHSGPCCGVGTSTCHGRDQKKKERINSIALNPLPEKTDSYHRREGLKSTAYQDKPGDKLSHFPSVLLRAHLSSLKIIYFPLIRLHPPSPFPRKWHLILNSKPPWSSSFSLGVSHVYRKCTYL